MLPVTSEENRRIEVFERELWRIAVEHLDYGEQVQWAALAGARVAPTGWRRARAMLHFDQGGELKRTFLITAVDRNKNPALRLRALQEIASGRDAEAFDRALDFVESWPRDDKREGVKVVLQALAEKKIGRRDQANNWIWRCANMTREIHEEYAVQRWPETKRLLGLLVNSSGGAHARNARRLVAQARTQDRRLSAALLAAAIPHTAEAGEVINGARTRMARKPAALARELLRNFPKGRGKAKRRSRRRKGAGEAMAPEAALVGAVNEALDTVLDDDELELDGTAEETTSTEEAAPTRSRRSRRRRTVDSDPEAAPRRGRSRRRPAGTSPKPSSPRSPPPRRRRRRAVRAAAARPRAREGTPSRRSRRKPAAEPVGEAGPPTRRSRRRRREPSASRREAVAAEGESTPSCRSRRGGAGRGRRRRRRAEVARTPEARGPAARRGHRGRGRRAEAPRTYQARRRGGRGRRGRAETACASQAGRRSAVAEPAPKPAPVASRRSRSSRSPRRSHVRVASPPPSSPSRSSRSSASRSRPCAPQAGRRGRAGQAPRRAHGARRSPPRARADVPRARGQAVAPSEARRTPVTPRPSRLRRPRRSRPPRSPPPSASPPRRRPRRRRLRRSFPASSRRRQAAAKKKPAAKRKPAASNGPVAKAAAAVEAAVKPKAAAKRRAKKPAAESLEAAGERVRAAVEDAAAYRWTSPARS